MEPHRVRPCSGRPPRATGGSPEVARWLPGTARERSQGQSVDFFAGRRFLRSFGRLEAMADMDCSNDSQPENHAMSLSPAALVLAHASSDRVERM